MIELGILRPEGSGLAVLCLGAHADDLEIGCGGTILRLLRERSDVTVHWVVFSGSPERAEEARQSANRFLRGARDANVTLHRFRDGFFPYAGAEIKEQFDFLSGEVDPDIILSHYGRDSHQDHRMISELTWNSFRSHLIMEYEIPKYDGDLGTPNAYVPLDETDRLEKVDTLMESFASQRTKHWFTRETFAGLMRIRGLECAAASGYAEGFYARKVVLRA